MFNRQDVFPDDIFCRFVLQEYEILFDIPTLALDKFVSGDEEEESYDNYLKGESQCQVN